uniref:Uncharacterized protein n=1 Tax=Oryza barthii TaxID=65489 RepID=A0A0D3HKK8_9ORYZ
VVVADDAAGAAAAREDAPGVGGEGGGLGVGRARSLTDDDLEEPDRRRPGGAQGVRGSGVRVQLRRDPRALRHAPGPRALLLHEPALPRRTPPLAGGGAGSGGPLLPGAAHRQLEDLQPWGQPR